MHWTRRPNRRWAGGPDRSGACATSSRAARGERPGGELCRSSSKRRALSPWSGSSERDVRVSFQFDPALDLVLVDKVQIQQVLLNLMRNGIEAMEGCDRRELSVSTVATDARIARITVSDTGTGIPEAIAAQLFQPFVTTKRQGMGSSQAFPSRAPSSRPMVARSGSRPTAGAAPPPPTLRFPDPDGRGSRRWRMMPPYTSSTTTMRFGICLEFLSFAAPRFRVRGYESSPRRPEYSAGHYGRLRV